MAGGTWLGCTRTGRFAALTNFSNPNDPEPLISRGRLVQDFLAGTGTVQAYADAIRGADYAGYNLLIFDGKDLLYHSNRAPTQLLKPGYYGLANAELGAKWPKCQRGAHLLEQISSRDHSPAELVALIA